MKNIITLKDLAKKFAKQADNTDIDTLSLFNSLSNDDEYFSTNYSVEPEYSLHGDSNWLNYLPENGRFAFLIQKEINNVIARCNAKVFEKLKFGSKIYIVDCNVHCEEYDIEKRYLPEYLRIYNKFILTDDVNLKTSFSFNSEEYYDSSDTHTGEYIYLGIEDLVFYTGDDGRHHCHPHAQHLSELGVYIKGYNK